MAAEPDLLAPVRSWFSDGVVEAMVHTVDAADAPAMHRIEVRRVDHGVVFGSPHASGPGFDLALAPDAVIGLRPPCGAARARIPCFATRLDDLESDRLFDELDRVAQLHEWRSGAGRSDGDPLAVARSRFAGQLVPRPRGWGGYRLIPTAVEVGGAQAGTETGGRR